MTTGGVELATAYVSIIPELSKGISQAYSDMTAAGKKIGDAYAKGATDGLTVLEAKAQSAAGAVKKASRDMEAAQKREADSLGALRVAQERLNEARANSNAKASQIAAAEEAVAKAQRNTEAATKSAMAATTAHQGAVTRASSASSAFASAQSEAAGSTSRIGKAYASVSGTLGAATSKLGGFVGQTRSLGVSMAGALAGVAIGSKIREAISASSDLNETINKSNVIFGSNAKAMEAWASNSVRTLGLSKQGALEAAALFGDMFSQIGFSGDQAAVMSKSVVQLATDLGSFNNLPTAQVTDMIAGAFRGEYDSLQRVIPNISAARVESEALSETHKKNAKDLTAAEKATATLAIIQKDGARAAGDFAKTIDGQANKEKVAAAEAENLKAALGDRLAPAMSAIYDVGLKVMDWMSQNTDVIGPLVVVLGAMAVAIWAVNLALYASPWTWVVAGLVALSAALIAAYQKVDWFRAIVDTAWSAIRTVIGAVVDWIVGTAWPAIQVAWSAIATAAMWLWQNALQPAWRGIQSAISGVVDFIRSWVVPLVQNYFAVIGGVVMWLWNNVVTPAFDGIRSVIERVAPVFGWLKDTIIQPVLDGIKTAFDVTVSAIGTIWNKLKELALTPIKWVVETVINGGIIDTYNKIVGFFPGTSPLPHMDVPHLAYGGAVPGVSPNPRADDKLIWATAGEFMQPVAAVDYYGPGVMEAMRRRLIPREMFGGYADGGLIGGIASALTGGLSAVWGFITDPVGSMSRLVDSLIGGIESNPFGALAVGMVRKMVGTLVDAIKGLFSSPAVADGVGSGVQRWAGVAAEAMALAGLPGSYLPLLLHRMQVESGGNQFAINLWDSNAIAGHPSQGLMQTIPGTFAAYAGPLASRGIYDPLANIYAAIKYTLARYGLSGIEAAWGGSGGYAEGGLIGATAPVEPVMYDAGGLLPPGLTLVHNATGRYETVRNAQQEAALARGGPQLIINGNVGYDPDDLARRVTRRWSDSLAVAGLAAGV